MRWGMVIDLQRCIGCYSCAMACKAENATPPAIYFRRVLTREEGTYPTARRIPVPVGCNHCENPPCVDVCPSGASHKVAENGTVQIDESVCIGCQYCIMACPYKARTALKQLDAYLPANVGFTTPQEIGGEAKIDWNAKLNTPVKCTFCEHRLEKAKTTGKIPGVDREATPACVVTCPAKAMFFGDLDNPNSEIRRLIAERNGFTLIPGEGTNPSLYYLPARF